MGDATAESFPAAGATGGDEAGGAQWVVLAQLLRPQGRRGEMLAELLTDFPSRFRDRPEVFLAGANFVGATSQARPATVQSYWLPVGKNEGRIVLQFAGVDSIGQAEELAGLEVLVPLEDRLPLEDGAAYLSDLVGCAVFDRGEPVGTVQAVDFPSTSDGKRPLSDAAPLLSVLGSDGLEILIPFAKDFLLGMDLDAKEIRMVLPSGLLEVNR